MKRWKEGKYLDTWSIVHFLSGLLLGGFFYWIETDLAYTIPLSIFLLILWEVFEWATKIAEHITNMVTDVIVGIAGLFVAIFVYYELNLFNLGVYLAILGTNIILAIWGFTSFIKRDRLS